MRIENCADAVEQYAFPVLRFCSHFGILNLGDVIAVLRVAAGEIPAAIQADADLNSGRHIGLEEAIYRMN